MPFLNRHVAAGFVATMLLAALPLLAQSNAHLIVVKMVDAPNAQFAFQPSEVAAQPGDTVRFVQASAAPHDIDFRKSPKGAKLGSSANSPYLITPGQTFDLVIDNRFPAGVYDFVCDPHESVGMHGTLTVGSSIK